MLEPESAAVKLLLDTPGLRKIGRHLIKTAIVRSTNGIRIALRPARGERAMAQQLLDSDLYQKYHKIQGNDVVLDIGAHIGIFTIKAGRKVGKQGKVLSIEPAHDNYELLVRNIFLNKLDETCIPIRCACGASDGFAKLRVFKTSVSNSFFERQSHYKFLYFEEVEVRTMDDIVSQLNIDRLDFVKINVEGSELDVIKGSTKTLKELHPSIAMDTHEFGPVVDTIEKFLIDFDYEKKEPTGQINYFV